MSPVLGLVVGLLALIVGADLVVREGSALAARLGISPFMVGITVVSLGTSLPELAIGVNAAQQGNAGLAVGNIVGTNLVNVLLILGVSALIRPVAFEARTLRVDLPAMTGAAALLAVLARDGALSTLDGGWLCAYGFAYLTVMIVLARREAADSSRDRVRHRPDASTAHDDDRRPADSQAKHPGTSFEQGRPTWLRAALLIVGLAVILVGSEFLVDGAVQVARDLGASDALIGLTIVAVGTSAPELFTTVLSTVRGERSIAIGNLLGSSVFNIALILGPTVLLAPGAVVVPDDVLALDLVLMLATAVVCVPVFISRRRLSRVEGGVFVTAYLTYMTWLLTTRL